MVNDNWGFDSQEAFNSLPLAKWDDCDVTVLVCEYTSNTVAWSDTPRTQIHTLFKPMQYEYEARGEEYVDGSIEGCPQDWYSLGSGVFEVSDDGWDIKGAPPQGNTQGVKFLKSIVSNIPNHPIKGKNISGLTGLEVHIKADRSTFPDRNTGEIKESIKLYVSGPPLGYSKQGRDGTATSSIEVQEELEVSDELKQSAELAVVSILTAADAPLTIRQLNQQLNMAEDEIGSQVLQVTLNRDFKTELINNGTIKYNEDDRTYSI